MEELRKKYIRKRLTDQIRNHHISGTLGVEFKFKDLTDEDFHSSWDNISEEDRRISITDLPPARQPSTSSGNDEDHESENAPLPQGQERRIVSFILYFTLMH